MKKEMENKSSSRSFRERDKVSINPDRLLENLVSVLLIAAVIYFFIKIVFL